MMLDGMVTKINSIATQEDLGYTVKFPRWSCAYKFPAVEKSTKSFKYRSSSGTNRGLSHL